MPKSLEWMIMIISIFLIGCQQKAEINTLPPSTLYWQNEVNNLWWKRGNILYSLDIDNQQLTEFEPGQLDVNKFFTSKGGQLWAYGREIAFFSNNKWIKTDLGYLVSDLYETEDGTIWAASSSGFFIWDHATKNWLRSNISSPGRTLVELPDGSLWLGSNNDGIVRLKNGEITRWSSSNGLADNEIWSLLVSSDNTLWMGTRWNVHHWDDQQWHKEGDIIGTLDADGPIIYSLFETNDATIWAATTAGIAKLDQGGWVVFDWSMCGSTINNFIETQNREFWVGCNQGLYYWNGQDWQEHGIDKGIESNSHSFLVEESNGYLYAATYSGIYQYDRNSHTWKTLLEF